MTNESHVDDIQEINIDPTYLIVSIIYFKSYKSECIRID